MWCGSAGLDAKERASPPSGPTVAHRKVAALAGTGKSITRVAKPRRREENDFRVMAFLICKLSATCHDDKRAVTAFPLTNRILLTSQSTALCKHKKAVRSTGRPFRKTAITLLGRAGRRLVVVGPAVVRASPAAGLRLHRRFIHLRRSLHIVVEVRSRRNQVVLHLVLTGVVRPYRDAARVDALLGYQIVLRVHRALRRKLFCGHVM